MRISWTFGAGLTALMLAACASQPAAPPPGPQKPSVAKPPEPPKPQGPVMSLQPVRFQDLPAWGQTDLAPALASFKRSCAVILRRPDDQALGRSALYGGTTRDWRPACLAAQNAAPEQARTLFERFFTPNFVLAREDQLKKLTSYYEPVIPARRSFASGFTEPLFGTPKDLVKLDMDSYDEALELSKRIAEDLVKALAPTLPDDQEASFQTTLEGQLARRFGQTFWARLNGDRSVGPYPKRGDLPVNDWTPLAYAHPADVYDLQVQGSGRLKLEDGTEVRAAYSAQNGYKWNSMYGTLRDRGTLQTGQLNKRNVRAWMDSVTPQQARDALNSDPSYVFFALEAINDPAAGPKGAMGVPLTALGSLAVDPSVHPYGALIFVDAPGADPDAPGGALQRLLSAQDTGGAIRRGPLRGDVFWGSGDQAGLKAERVNAEPRFWTLIPKPAFDLPVAEAGAGQAGKVR